MFCVSGWREGGQFSILHDMGTVPLPKGAIIIPVYYYYEHLEKNGLLPELKAILDDPLLKTDPSYRKRRLKDLRTAIMEAPVDLKLLHAIDSALHHFSDYPSYRFRSSTNAEDLDFSAEPDCISPDQHMQRKEKPALLMQSLQYGQACGATVPMWNVIFLHRSAHGGDGHSGAPLLSRVRKRTGSDYQNPYNVNPGYQGGSAFWWNRSSKII